MDDLGCSTSPSITTQFSIPGIFIHPSPPPRACHVLLAASKSFTQQTKYELKDGKVGNTWLFYVSMIDYQDSAGLRSELHWRTGVMVNAPVSGVCTGTTSDSWRFLGSSPRFVGF